MRPSRPLPLVLILLLAVGVPMALAADPSTSPSESASANPAASEAASESPAAPELTSATPAESASGSPTATQAPSASAAPSESAAAPTPAESVAPSATPPPPTRPAEPAPRTVPDVESEATTTLRGVVGSITDGKGRPHYTLTSAGKTYELSDGPPWFWGDKNPLAAYVGKSVTVVGEVDEGGTKVDERGTAVNEGGTEVDEGGPEVDVQSINGKLIRDPGKPPWAGGPWVVGPRHPGWKSWMGDGKDARRHGRAFAPGQLKKVAEPTEDESHGT